MNETDQSKQVFVWMQMLGFNRDDADKGVSRYLEQTGFTPNGICALLFHSDLVNWHRGMDEEYVLPPDICAYYGIPRNIERERQPWTNYDLRALCQNMKAAGSGIYASLMGSYLNDMFHREWLSDHPELRYLGRTGLGGLHCLKRLADGSYFEDVFVEKLVRTLEDYGFEGVHITDGFCPIANSRYEGDFSTDMTEQFSAYAGVTLPESVAQSMGDDGEQAIGLRGDWLWSEHREAWLTFHTWRWEGFFRKICDRVHAIEKKVLVLGMYCTDPFESLYLMGFDLAGVIRAGVDYVMPNIVATGMYMETTQRSFFHRYMNIVPLVKAQTPEGKYLCMLGVQDASEEWDILHHAPCKLERDVYTMLAYQYVDGHGPRRAMDGLMICLGDSMRRADWDWLNERIALAFDADVQQVAAPVVVWSNAAHERTLAEYIRTRRWSTHKFLYETAKQGTLAGGAVRIEHISACHGALYVPNFDLLPAPERAALAAYAGGPVLCLAGPEYDPETDGLAPTACFEDRFAAYPMKALVLNARLAENLPAQLEALLSDPDDTPDLDPASVQEQLCLLQDDLPFRKVSEGFVRACALLLRRAGGCPFDANVPFTAFRLKNGAYRLLLYGLYEGRYSHALVRSEEPIADAKVFSKFPVLPVRFTTDMNTAFHFAYGKEARHSFQLKLQPGGTTMVDVWME